MNITEEKIKHLEQTIADLYGQVEQLQGDLMVALEAMEKMEDALKHFKTKKWWKLWKQIHRI